MNDQQPNTGISLIYNDIKQFFGFYYGIWGHLKATEGGSDNKAKQCAKTGVFWTNVH